MRSLEITLACAIAAALLAAAPAGAVLQSDNVTLQAKLPEAVSAIGARFSPDGSTMYVTGARGLLIYDVSDAAAPTLLSVLPLPHFENEDVDVGRDTVVISNDPSFSTVGAIYLIDVSDPSAPSLRKTLVTKLPAGRGDADADYARVDCRPRPWRPERGAGASPARCRACEIGAGLVVLPA